MTLSRIAIAAAALAALPVVASADILDTQFDSNGSASNFLDDGVISAGEYTGTFTNGGGDGFGGTLGGGTFFFDADDTDLHIGFTPGGDLGANRVVLYFDTRQGGFTTSTMDDTGDASRYAISTLGQNGTELFPDDFSADYAVVFADYGQASFELQGTGTPHNFLNFEDDQSGSGSGTIEFSMSLADLGMPTNLEFFAALVSFDGFLSSESFPMSTALNSGGNPGFDGDATFENTNLFVVPEPTSAALLVGLGVLGLRRRR